MGKGPTCLERCVMLTSRAEELGVVIPHVIRGMYPMRRTH